MHSLGYGFSEHCFWSAQAPGAVVLFKIHNLALLLGSRLQVHVLVIIFAVVSIAFCRCSRSLYGDNCFNDVRSFYRVLPLVQAAKSHSPAWSSQVCHFRSTLLGWIAVLSIPFE